MNFAQFIAPTPVETFISENFGQRPLHIQGHSPRGELFSLPRLQELLEVRSHWTEQNLKLILNSRPILADHFLAAHGGSALRLADPAKVQLFVRMGASLVGDHIEEIDRNVRGVAAMLSAQFAATAGANVYYSSKDIQAFGSHCDLHEVFAIQLEGEKSWRIYENRAEAPVDVMQGSNAQAIIDRAKGRVMMTVLMKPGDLLYIPRGYFHDAVAQTGSSLHLTFGVRPLDGRYLFRLLEEQAIRNPNFRAYLSDGRQDFDRLRAQLASLSDEIVAMMRSPSFEMRLATSQRAQVMRAEPVNLASAGKLNYFGPTGNPAEVLWSLDGPVLKHAGGGEQLGCFAEAVEWAIGQAMFSEQQLGAQFPWLSNEEVQSAIGLLTRYGLIARFEPAL